MEMFESIKCSSKMRIILPIIGLLISSHPSLYFRDEIPKIKEGIIHLPPHPHPRALGCVQHGETDLGFS